ncbi:TPA: phage replisome organizer N-terminal domain-containing protein [Streptococcus suis]
MADNKKYYYLKLKDNFFESDEAIILESMPDGYIYSNILLKLYLRSLKNNGLLMFNDLIPYNAQMLATITRHHIGVIEKAIQIFQQLRLIDILDNGAIYMTNIQNFVGQSSTNADRMRESRQQLQMLNKCAPEIELEKDKELEKNKELEKDKEQRDKRYILEKENILSGKPDYVFPNWLTQNMIDEIKKGNPENSLLRTPLAYLNHTINKNYKYIDKNLKPIKARFNEGYTLDDFKQVIDNKVADWINNPEFSKYLRPETLFGTKFDSYLNQTSKPAQELIEDNMEPLPF